MKLPITRIGVVAAVLVLLAIIVSWPSAEAPFAASAKGIAAALVPVLSAMFGAFLAVHGYELREARALRRRLIEEMFRAGHRVSNRYHELRMADQPVPTAAAAPAARALNEALESMAMYTRLYGSADLNAKWDAILLKMQTAMQKHNMNAPEVRGAIDSDLEDLSALFVGLAETQFKDEQVA